MYQYFIPFYGQVIPYFMDISYFVYPFINFGTFFLLLAIMNNVIYLHVSVWTKGFKSLGRGLGAELLGHGVILCLTLPGTGKLLPSTAVLFYVPTTNV